MYQTLVPVVQGALRLFPKQRKGKVADLHGVCLRGETRIPFHLGFRLDQALEVFFSSASDAVTVLTAHLVAPGKPCPVRKLRQGHSIKVSAH